MRLATRELHRRPGRAVLTVLAVALAAALLSALLTIAGTAKTRVLSQLSHGGSLAGISVEPNAPNPSQETLDDPEPGPARAITASAIADISRLKDVLSVYPVSSLSLRVRPLSGEHQTVNLCNGKPSAAGLTCNQITVRGLSARQKRHAVVQLGGSRPQPVGTTLISGISTTLLTANLMHVGALPITLLAGRLPSPTSSVEVDVGTSYLQQIGITQSKASEVVGTRIAVTTITNEGGLVVSGQKDLEVVGVVDQQLGSGDLLGWPKVGRAVQTFMSTLPTVGTGAGGAGSSGYVGAVVIAKALGDVPAVRSKIATIGYSTTAPVGLIISVGRYLHVVELVLSGIGLVALGIAALGIANALLAAIRERRREIGVLKAIGARDRDVLRVFLLEAGALGLVGGAVGTLLGILMAALIAANANAYLNSQGLAGVALSVPWILPVGGILGAAVISLLAGTFPAWRAARLPARDAVDI